MMNYRCILSALVATASIAGCAASTGDPARSETRSRCPQGEVFSCVERMGKPERCFCADKDTMRELLEPAVD